MEKGGDTNKIGMQRVALRAGLCQDSPMHGSRYRAVLILLALLGPKVLMASDWPQLLGPTRDAVYSGPALADIWPTNGPPVVWKRDVGEGYANPVIAQNRLVISHRLENDLVVDCLDPQTGSNYWSFRESMKFQDGAYFDSGPRPTPAIKDGKVFVHNTDGNLICLDLNRGIKIWSRQTKTEFKSSATWHGCVASPLVTDKAVILPVGGSNAAVVAFAPATGDVVWRVLDDKVSASSPILATLGGNTQLLVVTRLALRSLNPDTGKQNWQFSTPKQTSGDVYAATPVVAGDYLFLSGWYGLGAQVLRVKGEGMTRVWSSDQALSTHYASGIIHQGHVYGFHGHAWESGGPKLRCIELLTGDVAWEQSKVGSGTVIRAGDMFLILLDTGEFQLVKANPKTFKVVSRVQVTGRTTRSYPAIADGFAYIKGPRTLVCLDLRPKK